MKAVATLLSGLALAVALGGCASTAPMPPADDLFHDAAFRAPTQAIDPDAALAISPAMRAYLKENYFNRTREVDRRRQLLNALFRGDLRLEYDAAITRNAAQAFDARSGNCLALVLMTASFAKELGFSVRYQSLIGEEAWSRSDDLYIGIGHVNLRLDDPMERVGFPYVPANSMVVDFLPESDARSLNTKVVGERTVIAMYLNNRAVESLTQGLVDDAYWYAREAIRTDRDLVGGYVTLGVVYRARHEPLWAEQVLRRVADHEPDNVYALSNRVLALRDLGRTTEADALTRRLEALDPNPPFVYFNEGMAAYRAGQIDAARRLFAKEVARAPYHHEFEYWLAVTYAEQHDIARATVHLKRAMDVSITRKDHDLYAGKLDRLRALRTQ